MYLFDFIPKHVQNKQITLNAFWNMHKNNNNNKKTFGFTDRWRSPTHRCGPDSREPCCTAWCRVCRNRRRTGTHRVGTSTRLQEEDVHTHLHVWNLDLLILFNSYKSQDNILSWNQRWTRCCTTLDFTFSKDTTGVESKEKCMLSNNVRCHTSICFHIRAKDGGSERLDDERFSISQQWRRRDAAPLSY